MWNRLACRCVIQRPNAADIGVFVYGIGRIHYIGSHTRVQRYTVTQNIINPDSFGAHPQPDPALRIYPSRYCGLLIHLNLPPIFSKLAI